MEEKLIYKAINEVMKKINFIGKDKTNMSQNYKFRGVDQVLDKLKDILEKNGVFIYQEVTDVKREEHVSKKYENSGKVIKETVMITSILTVKHHFTAVDGSEIVVTTVGEGVDTGDKATNKAMAAAFKYACFYTFCIPTEDMAKDDPDNYSPEIQTREQQPAPKPQQPKPQAAPQPAKNVPTRKEHTINFLKNLPDEMLKQYMDYFKIEDVDKMTDGQVNAVIEYVKGLKKK